MITTKGRISFNGACCKETYVCQLKFIPKYILYGAHRPQTTHGEGQDSQKGHIS